MNIVDAIKKTATKILGETELGKQAVALVQEAAQKLEGNSVEILSNQAVYRSKISDPTYGKLPGVLRSLLEPEQWHEFLFAAKDSFFVVEENRLHLQASFKADLNAFVMQLVHGKKALKPAEATIDAVAEALPQPVLPPQDVEG